MTASRIEDCSGRSAVDLQPAEVADAIGRAKAELEQAVAKSGLSNDPLRFALGGLAAALDAFLVGILAVRQPIDLRTMESLTRQAAAAAGEGARREVLRLSRATNLRSSIAVGVAVPVIILASLVGGFFLGKSEEAARAAVVFQSLSPRLRDGSAAANAWLGLMRENDIIEALRKCEGRAAWTDGSGRKACSVPLWLEPSSATPSLAGR